MIPGNLFIVLLSNVVRSENLRFSTYDETTVHGRNKSKFDVEVKRAFQKTAQLFFSHTFYIMLNHYFLI